MPEPNEPLTGLIIPNTGDLPAAWGTSAVNPNFTAIGGMFAGFATISLSVGTTIALTGPSGSITPGAGPTQQQNAMLRFTGSQSGTATIQFSKPGSYVIDNQASTAFPIILAPASGTGTQVGAPWGRKTRIFFDGTNVDFENPPDPGTAIDLHGMTGLPNWMTVCTKQWALVKDGSTYSTSTYSALFNVIGSTFGGNGVTTFQVPDERARMRIALDTNPGSGFANRVTSVSGINGSTMGAAGGDQLLQAHTHVNSLTVTDPGHTHNLDGATAQDNSGGRPLNGNLIAGNNSGGGAYVNNGLNGNFVQNSTTSISVSITNATTGSGGGQNMPPTIVSFLALIKT